jgi:hypothetical protein
MDRGPSGAEDRIPAESIQALDPIADDSLADELLETNASFRVLVEKSKASPRTPFLSGPAS